MPVLRRRAKKMMRKKHKRTIKLKDLDRIWAVYVDWAIKHLLKYGSVRLGNHVTLEIVGKRIIDDNRAFSVLSNGKYITYNKSLKEVNLSSNRSGIIYKIKATNPQYKGTVIFESDPYLRKRVSECLSNTKQYFKIQ